MMKNEEKIAALGKFRLNDKLMALPMMIFILGSSCQAAVFAPEWTEFCPPRYCESNDNVFSKDATYWHKRRMQFNNAIAKCSSFHGKEQESCYNEIRAAEERKNQVWAVRQEEKYRTDEYNRQYNMERMEFDGIQSIIESIKK